MALKFTVPLIGQEVQLNVNVSALPFTEVVFAHSGRAYRLKLATILSSPEPVIVGRYSDFYKRHDGVAAYTEQFLRDVFKTVDQIMQTYGGQVLKYVTWFRKENADVPDVTYEDIVTRSAHDLILATDLMAPTIQWTSIRFKG